MGVIIPAFRHRCGNISDQTSLPEYFWEYSLPVLTAVIFGGTEFCNLHLIPFRPYPSGCGVKYPGMKGWKYLLYSSSGLGHFGLHFARVRSRILSRFPFRWQTLAIFIVSFRVPPDHSKNRHTGNAQLDRETVAQLK